MERTPKADEAQALETDKPQPKKRRNKSKGLSKPEVSAPFVERMLDRQSGFDFEEEARRHPTLLIRRTLRSGQRVRFYGNVVVLGDVNPGAEITAGGDIVVMGWLRGLAHAGAEGDGQAIVAAFRLNPTQLRIGHVIGRAPDQGEAVLPDVPEVAEVRDGRLVIDRWQKSVLTAVESL
ncbi:septum site-determining protein MinC [Sulfobacillus harzensis]|uniref:Septum site-determining protein MinC n=1 Tax=Sulfobacillus harzensis TaxID=2729629 RepID=A0A7Y0Q1A0_9FIRM|nr:septum site-determining protein MinC [Sulfobacillus harzensis]NMP21242.1 septum site-determining protein MinC [Sulfobacillus harzensis]